MERGMPAYDLMKMHSDLEFKRFSRHSSVCMFRSKRGYSMFTEMATAFL
jgi:hypothetical protein